MSSTNYGLLSLSITQDHFQSAFMNGYGGHHQTYDHERYNSHSHSSPYLHTELAATRDSYSLPDRRLSDPYLRPNPSSTTTTTATTATSLPRQHYPLPSFDYHHHHHHHSPTHSLPQSNGVVRREPTEHGSASLRNLVDFDPRPPHAGWTPKEEVDEEVQSRELLNTTTSGGHHNLNRTSPGSDLGLNPAPVPPRDDSLSPGGPVPGNGSTSGSASSKTYSFVSLPGNAVRKRPRRRYDEIERLYACSWPDCSKAYGTLNHLNAHVSMQRHGQKRSPSEFKELRKQWRAQKKQDHTIVHPTTTTSIGSTHNLEPHMRRRATEPNIALPRDHTLSHASAHAHAHHLPLNHRLSLGDLHYSPEDEHLATSPTSTSATSDQYWQDSPLSTHYPSIALQGGGAGGGQQNLSPSPTLTPPGTMAGGGAGAGQRLDSNHSHNHSTSLLAPLPGYRPSPPSTGMPTISRLGPGSTLLQPLSAGTLASLSPGPGGPHHHVHGRSPQYDDFPSEARPS